MLAQDGEGLDHPPDDGRAAAPLRLSASAFHGLLHSLLPEDPEARTLDLRPVAEVQELIRR